MKILIVHPHMSICGGAETVVKELSNCLAHMRFKSAVLTLSLSQEVRTICNGIDFILPSKKNVYKIRSTNLFNALGIIKEIIKIRELLNKNIDNFGLINVHNFPATWAIVGINKPVVWVCNELPDLWNNTNPSLPLRILRKIGILLDKFIVNRYIRTICVADKFNAYRVFRRYGRETEIVPYSINYDFFSQDNNLDNNHIRRRYNLNNNFILLQVGMLSPEKNQLGSIKTLEKLKVNIPNIKLILAGMGNNSYEEKLKDYIHQKRLDEYVIFTGHLSSEKIRALYHLCNVAIFPVKSQGGWLSPFEAMCAGKSVIVSLSMGAATLINEKNLGIVTENFKDTIIDIYKNPFEYYRKSELARKWVQENLSSEIFSKKIFKVFEKTLIEGQKLL